MTVVDCELPPRVLVGMPVKHHVSTLTVVALDRTFRELDANGIDHALWLEPRGDVCTARNLLASRTFLADPLATHLLLVDDDVGGFDGALVARLVRSGEHVTGAPIPGRGFEPQILARALASGITPEAALLHLSPLLFKPLEGAQQKATLREVERLGTGFLCLTRACVLAMIEAHADRLRTFQGGTLVELFRFSVDAAGTWLGEDYAFCDAWRRLGGRVWADREAALLHLALMPFHAPPLRSLGL